MEDEEKILDLIELSLKKAGYNILKAADPRKAVNIARRNKIDLLLTDVIMPGMNGKELQIDIEKLQPNIRTLFMSGYTDDVITEKTLGIPERDLICKPFTLKGLADKIREIFGRVL